MPPRRARATVTKSLEATLWEAADKLRGNLEASEYKHVVLGLVFLKYVSDAFTQRRTELEALFADPESDGYISNEARREKLLESRDEYAGANVFWVPPEARWGASAAQREAGEDRLVHRPARIRGRRACASALTTKVRRVGE